MFAGLQIKCLESGGKKRHSISNFGYFISKERKNEIKRFNYCSIVFNPNVNCKI
jgi:hypothetical protein